MVIKSVTRDDEKLPDVGHESGDVVFRTGVEVIFVAGYRRVDTLVLAAKIPPMFGVLGGLSLSAEYVPSEFVDHVSERQESEFIEGLRHQEVNVYLCQGRGV